MEWNDFISLITRLEKDEDYKFCLLISLGVFTGLRISDLLTLRYTDVLNKDVLKIKEIKTGKDRSIKINKDLKEILERIVSKLKVSNRNELIFVNRFGTKSIDKSYVNVKLKEIFKKYRIKVGGNVSTHTFRKTLGCLVVEVLSPAPERAALLSHAVCPAASSAPRGAFAYSVYPLWGLETVSRATRCRSLRAAIALLYEGG
jgi:integrase